LRLIHRVLQYVANIGDANFDALTCEQFGLVPRQVSFPDRHARLRSRHPHAADRCTTAPTAPRTTIPLPTRSNTFRPVVVATTTRSPLTVSTAATGATGGANVRSLATAAMSMLVMAMML
jgi:hypothetical protein